MQARKWAIRIGLLTFSFLVFLCLAILLNNGGNPLTFAWIGTRFSERDPNGTVGYDGQFVYYIARDGATAVPYIDGPSLRYQRIVYPLLARVLALGQADWVPWTLIIVNIVAHSAGTALMTYLLVGHRVAPYFGLTYGLWLGALYGIRFNLNEPLCFALALGAVVAYRHDRRLWTVFLLMLATMTKELGLVFAAGIALHALSQKQRRWAVLYAGAPLLLFLVWWLLMLGWFGTLPTHYPAARFQPLPLYGLFTEETPLEFFFLTIWLAIPAVVLFVAALRHIYQKRIVSFGAALVIFGAGFVMGMPAVSWQDPVAAFRVGMPLIITGLLFVAECYPQRTKVLVALWAPGVLVFILLVLTLFTAT